MWRLSALPNFLACQLRFNNQPGYPTPLILVEAAVESLESALAAERGGADRIELCASLDDGGTTPTPELIASVVDRTKLPVFVLIRARAGGFVYSDDEVAAMSRDIAHVPLRRGAGGTNARNLSMIS